MKILKYLVVFLIISCNNREFKQGYNSDFKGNDEEFSLLLKHYKSNENFKTKYVKFFLKNMPGHFSPDTTGYFLYLDFLKKTDSIISLEYPEETLQSAVNELWEPFKKKNISTRKRFANKIYDVYNIKADQIIDNIDIKYSAWKNNKFMKDQPEQIFISHILPYRVVDNIMPDDYFIKMSTENLSIINSVKTKDLGVAVDSLLIKYKNIIYSADILPSFPYFTTTSALKSKRIKCEDRVWFNYYLLTSAGIATAIDFIPNWGNRNAAHTWNTIITKDSIIPFEPFYSTDRWEYKRIYDNKMEDGFVKWWGKFRLPKVYRYTYNTFENDLIKDDRVEAEDVPSLFRTDKIKDVSSEYFETADVRLKLTRVRPEGVYYAFLCVQNRRNWIPVQYGKIHNNKVQFKDMGMDIVYLPAYYKEGNIIPAGDPFYLSNKGEIIQIVHETSKTASLNLVRRYPMNDKKFYSHRKLINSCFLLANSSDFSDSTISYKNTSVPEMKPYILNINKSGGKYRYVRFLCDEDAYLSELKIIIKNRNQKRDTLIYDSNYIEQNTKNRKYLHTNYIDIDLGEKNTIIGLGFCGLNDIFCIIPGKTYELFYWDGKWVSAGKQLATKDYLVYSDIPCDKLYYLDCSDNDAFKRAFVYKKNKQLFW
jgi:hypothetical protein